MVFLLPSESLDSIVSSFVRPAMGFGVYANVQICMWGSQVEFIICVSDDGFDGPILASFLGQIMLVSIKVEFPKWKKTQRVRFGILHKTPYGAQKREAPNSMASY